MELHPIVLENIKKSGYIRPRKVQQYTIPYIFDGMQPPDQLMHILMTF